ncbi:MAG: AAA family ATPase [Spirochaetales bacterium]|nr:AAA family ATPase [Spirochaetales bacterium]
MKKRCLSGQVSQDLKKKMVLLAGPRQVGKTTLAKALLGKGPGYLNWDIPDHRQKILAGEMPVSDFWVFDEIHKYKKWRNFLKWVHFLQDTEGRDIYLKYFRDIDGRETDFVVEENSAPFMFVEVKTGDDDIAKGLKYLKARFPETPAWQISLSGTKDYISREKIRVTPAITLLKELV